MASIAIIGVGAIGSVAAALLERGGRHEVILCVRRPLPELRVTGPAGEHVVQARRLTDPATAPAVDFILIATKAYDSEAAAAWLPRLGARGAPVAVLQNGVEHRERFAAHAPPERIIPVVVNCPVERAERAVVRQRGTMLFKCADDAGGRRFAALFDGPDAEAITVPDFTTEAWRKLCLNAAGVVNGLLLKPNGALRDEAVGAAAREIVRECAAVGRAEGAKLPAGIEDEILAACRAAPADGINSLLADRMAGRPTEIQARNGVIVRLGRKHGIATPCNQMAVALVEATP